MFKRIGSFAENGLKSVKSKIKFMGLLWKDRVTGHSGYMDQDEAAFFSSLGTFQVKTEVKTEVEKTFRLIGIQREKIKQIWTRKRHRSNQPSQQLLWREPTKTLL